MCIRYRPLSLLYKILLVGLCGFGLFSYTGLAEGRLDLAPFKYYTILSNLLVFVFYIFAAVYTARRIAKNGTHGYSTYAPQFKGAVIMAITVTLLIYQFILAPTPFAMSATENPLRNNIVHLLVPIMVLADWLLFDRKGRWHAFAPVAWEAIPLAYFGYTIIAAMLGVTYLNNARYPYYFINVDNLGWAAVLRNVIILSVAFLALGYVLWGLDKLLGIWDKKPVNRRIYRAGEGISVPSGTGYGRHSMPPVKVVKGGGKAKSRAAKRAAVDATLLKVADSPLLAPADDAKPPVVEDGADDAKPAAGDSTAETTTAAAAQSTQEATAAEPKPTPEEIDILVEETLRGGRADERETSITAFEGGKPEDNPFKP